MAGLRASDWGSEDGVGGSGRSAVGGVQLILCGDFLQLPPVEETLPPELLAGLSTAESSDCTSVFGNRGYCFQAMSWRRCAIRVLRLTRAHRQGDDAKMVRALQAMRRGETCAELTALVADCSPGGSHAGGCGACRRCGGVAATAAAEQARGVHTSHGIKPTRLFCKNIDVDELNLQELAQLPAGALGPMDSVAKDDVEAESDAQQPLTVAQRTLLQGFFAQCRAPQQLRLKLRAQVMLLYNLSASLVNGSRGEVVGAELWTEVRPDTGPKVQRDTTARCGVHLRSCFPTNLLLTWCLLCGLCLCSISLSSAGLRAAEAAAAGAKGRASRQRGAKSCHAADRLHPCLQRIQLQRRAGGRCAVRRGRGQRRRRRRQRQQWLQQEWRRRGEQR